MKIRYEQAWVSKHGYSALRSSMPPPRLQVTIPCNGGAARNTNNGKNGEDREATLIGLKLGYKAYYQKNVLTLYFSIVKERLYIPKLHR